MYSKKSPMWDDYSSDKEVHPDFLDPEHSTARGIGSGKFSEQEYAERFANWVDRYKSEVSPDDLSAYPEPATGKPRIVESMGYRSSVPYLKNMALAKLVTSLCGRKNIRILEIGAGYGGMAEILTRMVSPSGYDIIDLPEMLPLSQYYLREVHSNFPYNFYLPDGIDSLGKYDLILNFSSFGEMPSGTAQAYIKFAMSHLSEGGVLISHNSVKRTLGGVVKASEYGFQNYHIRTLLPQHTIAGAFYDQHLILAVVNGEPNYTGEKLDYLQSCVGLGLHEDIKAGNSEAMENMQKMATSLLFRKSYALKYLASGKSTLARSFACKIAGLPLVGPTYLIDAVNKAGKKDVMNRLKKAVS